VRPEYPLSRDALFHQLRDNGIYARRYFYPLISDFPMYRGLASAVQSNLPVARKAAGEVICLPIYPDLSIEQVDGILGVIVALHKKSGQKSEAQVTKDFLVSF
jgi:dTDP-4-amino-4,6-dideoxygalactose transaminase